MRYKEVCLMLNSENPFWVWDWEQRQDIKEQVLKGSLRQFSKCIGWGSLTLGTIQTIPIETLNYPEISKVGLIGDEKKKHSCKDEIEN